MQFFSGFVCGFFLSFFDGKNWILHGFGQKQLSEFLFNCFFFISKIAHLEFHCFVLFVVTLKTYKNRFNTNETWYCSL